MADSNNDNSAEIWRRSTIAGPEESAQRESAERLRENEERLRLVIEATNDGVWEWNIETGAMTWSSRVFEMLGLDPGSLGLNFEGFKERIHPEDVAAFSTALRQHLYHGKPFSMELRLRRADDSHGHYLLRGKAQYVANGNPLRMVGAVADITRRIEAEGQLRRSEERFRRLVEDARDAIFALSPDGLITSMNSAVESIAGWKPEEWIGQTFPPIIHPADQPLALQVFHRVMQGEKPGPFELRVTRKSGGFAPVEFTVTPQFQDARVVGVLGIGRDLSERKQTEQQLERERNQLRTLIDNLPASIYIKDTAGRFVVNNLAHTRQLGFGSESDLLGKTVFDLFPTEIAEAFDRDDKDVMRTDQPVLNREEPYEVNGRKGWFSTTKVALHDKEGRITGLLGITRDTTNTKLEQLERIRLVTAVEQSADSVVMLTPDGRIEFVNPAFARIAGRPREELAGRPYDEFLRQHGVRPSFLHITDRIARSGAWTGRLVARQADGTKSEHESSISAIRDEAGAVINYLCINRDVSKVTELEEQVRQSQKMDAIGQLAGGVAHDFNNILTVIEGHASLIQMIEPPADIAESAREIALASNRAANLTRQLLTFSRRQVMQPKSLDLNEVVSDMTKMLRRILGEDISLDFSARSNLPFIQADFGMIQQVLLNLAVNSRDAMPKGGRLAIATSAEVIDDNFVQIHPDASCGEFVCLSVGDTGCGIAPENLTRIFEPFFTTKEVGKGTGLGLATVYGIVKQHQGWITVQSSLGTGTRFRIYLPSSSVRSTGNTELFTRREMRGGTETILLVEDEAPVRILARNFLQNQGYKIIEAASGAEALRLSPSVLHSADLLLTDLVMPDGVNGRELAEKLQAIKPGIKIIFTSGYSADVAGRDFVLDPNLNFLQKPYHPRHLALTVRDCLDGIRHG